jgi:hypothetical protein
LREDFDTISRLNPNTGMAVRDMLEANHGTGSFCRLERFGLGTTGRVRLRGQAVARTSVGVMNAKMYDS